MGLPKNKPPKRPDYSLIAITWNIGAAIVILPLLGFFLDHHFHTSYVITVLGGVLAIIYAFYEAWKVLK